VNNTTTGVEHVEVDFSSYTGSGHRIAFRNILQEGSTSLGSYNFIDDISLSRIPDKIAEVETGNGGNATGDGSVADETEIGTPMGVDGFVDELENLIVYPNPTNGQLHIDAVDVTRVECYSQMGQLVAVFEHERDLDISHLSSGVYMLRVTLPQGVAVRKIVKN
ncbi:MAG: T9SS type A sorting domain-containing protein, partial [Bacteroidales bacterium]|nr:T9SS type A sorting domain-containing protein [Bacteroidales bacterium]